MGRVGGDVGDSGSPYAQGKHRPATGCHAPGRRPGSRPGRCLRCLLLVMCTHPFAKKGLTLHLARSEGREPYLGGNLMHRKVLASSHQHLMAEAPVYFKRAEFWHRTGWRMVQVGAIRSRLETLKNRAWIARGEKALELSGSASAGAFRIDASTLVSPRAARPNEL